MTNRFAYSFNTVGSSARAGESVCAFSDSANSAASAVLSLTMDTAHAVSVFVIARIIIIRLYSAIMCVLGVFSRSRLKAVRAY